MAREDPAAPYRRLYARLVRLYPAPHRERFAEGMEQTFGDLCRERQEIGAGLLGLALWVFVETSTGIVRERVTHMGMQRTTRRLAAWAAFVVLLLLIPFVAMRFTDEVNWDVSDFVVMGTLLFGVGVVYELASRKGDAIAYRVAVGVALGAAFLLVWVNLAVGIIGNAGNAANLMYLGVIAVGGVGAIVARFRPGGMARAALLTALAQVLVTVVAVLVWPPQMGVGRMFVLSGVFVVLFVGSALLFQHAASERTERGVEPGAG